MDGGNDVGGGESGEKVDDDGATARDAVVNHDGKIANFLRDFVGGDCDSNNNSASR